MSLQAPLNGKPRAALDETVRTWRYWLTVGALFAALTLLATWPQVLRLGDGVKDPGDPVFNSWVLAWNAHKLERLEFADYFDANIFYPHRRTLAYSEHLFPQSLLAAPIIWATGNPVLAHNVILLMSFFTSALGMFALARRLTGATLPSLLAGVIFAFSPFTFDHLSHVQILAAGGIPLSLLFLDRFLEHRKSRDALLFAAVFTAQILANGYYALFLSLAVGFFLLIELPRRRLLGDGSSWRGLVVAGVLVLAVAAPFFRQYVLMQQELALRREVMSKPTLASYLAAPTVNRLYGKWSKPLRTPEGQLSPGVMALLLALAGAVTWARRGGPASRAEKALTAAAAVAASSAAWVAVVGPLSLRPLLSVSSSLRPAILAALLLAAAALVRSFRLPREGDGRLGVYGALGLLAFALTFGEEGPYWLLHRWVPGFDGIRAVSRVHVLTMLAIALLAAWGTRALLARARKRPTLIFTALLAVVALEYASVPLPLVRVALDEEEHRLYRWVARATGEGDALLELPLPRDRHEWWRLELRRMLASTTHWRPLVNGFSGLAPPLYYELQRRWRERPLADNLADARALGVRYLVVHRRRDGTPWGAGVALGRQLQTASGVRLVQLLPQAWVFEVQGSHPAHVLGRKLSPATVPVRHITASVHPGDAPLALDGKLGTRWSTGRSQRPGDSMTIELGKVQGVAGLRLHLGRSSRDYPRGWLVEAAREGQWNVVGTDSFTGLPITFFLSPRDPFVDITFPPTFADALRLTSTHGDPVYYWSIHEVEVLAAH
ncbi:MAG: discoidin domain-containing protein [Acidobacteriota bacterium]|mgnify:CR=1 FL=1